MRAEVGEVEVAVVAFLQATAMKVRGDADPS